MNTGRLGSMLFRVPLYLASFTGLAWLISANGLGHDSSRPWSGWVVAGAYVLGSATAMVSSGLSQYLYYKRIESDASKGGSRS